VATRTERGGRRARGARLARLFPSLVAGVVLGLLGIWLTLRSPAGVIRNGPWQTDLATGSTAAGPVTRARIAVAGLLALSNTEAIYFFAGNDDEGRPLDAACDYRVEGRDPESAWWSITLYDEAGYLLANEAQRFSVSRTTVGRDAAGAFSVRVAPRGSGADWLPSPAAGHFNLALRCYEPSTALRANPGTVALPRIVRETCR
jgi:hypothetical protein